MFAHSKKDAVLVAIAACDLGLMVFAIATFPRLPTGLFVLMVAVGAFLRTTNYQCVAHYSAHLPLFRSDHANRLFAVFDSVTLGVQHALFRAHHLHHHKHGNDPATDISSTRRHGAAPGEEEGLFRYALLQPFRTDVGELFRYARKLNTHRQAVVESVVVVVSVIALLALNPIGFAAYYLPVWLLGRFFAFAENHLEHRGARPGSNTTDSVSCYSRWYNWLWLNNGYHQEHHYRPQLHWTQLPTLRGALPPEDERVVVRHAHWLNLWPWVVHSSRR